MKDLICAGIGMIGSFVVSFFGGWDASLSTLVIFMAIDYVSGLITAGVFHKSTKTDSGTLESRAGFKGLCRKCMILLFVLIGHRLDLIVGTTYIRDAVCIAFCVNELLSILENTSLMGIPYPPALRNAIDVLQEKAGRMQEEKKEDDDNGNSET